MDTYSFTKGGSLTEGGQQSDRHLPLVDAGTLDTSKYLTSGESPFTSSNQGGAVIF